MIEKRKFIRLIIISIVLTAAITGTLMFTLMRPGGHTAAPGPETARASIEARDGDTGTGGDREIIYWRAPMDPMEIYDEPGKSKMGMDLVPVYADEVSGGADTGGERKIVYWRSPMDPAEIYDEPGKSKMGMDLVPVYEDEVVGGVDIKIDPVVQQNMGLKTAEVQKGGLATSIRTYGHITYDDTRTSVVSAKTGGWIERLHADYTGFFVEKGAPLYEIYSPDLVAAQEAYLTAFKNHARHRSALNAELLASARKRLSYFDIGDEEISGIEAAGRVSKQLVVRSKVSGVVTAKNVVEGMYVRPGAGLFTISDLSRVWVEAHIFEYEQHKVREGQAAEMILSYQPDKIYTGKITYVFPYLQPKTRDVVIRLEFENPDLMLKPDMFARIKIDTGEGDTGLFIPAEAVIHSGDRQIVFLRKPGGKFSPRQVTTGMALDNGSLEVLTGLSRGDEIVVSGQFLLDSESKLKEAIQKMMDAKNPAAKKTAAGEAESGDDFFDDMEDSGSGQDDFFEDME
ncbi:MAG: efflux RND transporter periplasmic adaptor subunit [Desulfobacterales bacterium]|nr:efflux RND transporter periplasmic adaptor subunit [Desulfobacterales bacterium]